MSSWTRSRNTCLSLVSLCCVIILAWNHLVSAYIWPYDQGAGFLSNCSGPYFVNSVFLEWRGGPAHFHMGVDIQELQDYAPVYAVTDGKFYYKGSISVETRYRLGTYDTYTFRYVHVQNFSNAVVNDSLVDDFFHTGHWCDTVPPYKCYFPRNVALATIGTENLHFEQVYRNDFFSSNPTIVKINPLFGSVAHYRMCSFFDNENPRVTSPNTIRLFRKYIGTQITGGSGTLADPYIIDADFDIVVRVMDKEGSPSAFLCGIYRLGYKIETTSGSLVKGYEAFKFEESENYYYESSTRPPPELSDNLQYIFHPTYTFTGDFSYYATNIYIDQVDATNCPISNLNCDGAQDGYVYGGTVMIGADLFANQTYKITVEVWDGLGHYLPYAFYVNYRRHEEK